jgi:hypothetical protein
MISMPAIDRRRAAIAMLGTFVIATAGWSGYARGAPPRARARAMTVYRDPGCGCCVAWARIAERAGYKVTLVERGDMTALKAKLGVPGALRSCHTSVVGGFAIEGHVPLAAVERLLAARPRGLLGIAVPGMPRGSPGMETPDGSRDAFKVLAFDAAGKSRAFSY